MGNRFRYALLLKRRLINFIAHVLIFVDWLKYHEIWMDNPLVNVDETSIEPILTEMYKTMIKSIRIFQEIPAVASVASDIRNQMDDFRPLIPIIQSVRNPGMKERHWEELYNTTGFTYLNYLTIMFR